MARKSEHGQHRNESKTMKDRTGSPEKSGSPLK